MAFFQRRSENDDEQASPSGNRKPATGDQIDWEFGPDVSAGLGLELPYAADYPAFEPARPGVEESAQRFTGPDRNLLEPFRGEQAATRVESVKRALDAALERWWQSGELASPGLLRDGLLALEAGNDLPESQRSLLLRTAIHLRKGMLTALAHQTDPERTALILYEAMFEGDDRLEPETVDHLRLHDTAAAEWAPLLLARMHELRDGTVGERRQHIDDALAYLEGTRLVNTDADLFIDGEAISDRSPWTPARAATLLVAVVFLVVVALWQLRRFNSQDMVLIPNGDYTIQDQDGHARKVRIRNILVDRTEVTNEIYRRCYDQGVCPWPAANDSATRSDYFLDTAFATYPVVNVDREAATTFCRWLGKRLPSADEWQVAAAIAPATGLYYAYPWGNQYQELAANGSRSGPGDTVQVGQYRPVGDSPFGLSDMAGNVAEWTSTGAGQDVQALGLVKGGSFQDGPENLLAAARREVAGDFTAPWLGFRCAQPRATLSTP